MQSYSVPVHTGQLLCQQAKQVHITSFLSTAAATATAAAAAAARPPMLSVCLATEWEAESPPHGETCLMCFCGNLPQLRVPK
jgi:hypothetical protein